MNCALLQLLVWAIASLAALGGISAISSSTEPNISPSSNPSSKDSPQSKSTESPQSKSKDSSQSKSKDSSQSKCKKATIERKDKENPIFERLNVSLTCKLDVADPSITSFTWSGVECFEKNKQTCLFQADRKQHNKTIKCSLPDCPEDGPTTKLLIYHMSREIPQITGYDGSYLDIGSSLTLRCTIRGGYPLSDLNFNCPAAGVKGSKAVKESNLTWSILTLKNISYSLRNKYCTCLAIWSGDKPQHYSIDTPNSIWLRIQDKDVKKTSKISSSTTEDDDSSYGYLALLLVIPGVAIAAVLIRRAANDKKREKYEREQIEVRAYQIAQQAKEKQAAEAAAKAAESRLGVPMHPTESRV